MNAPKISRGNSVRLSRGNTHAENVWICALNLARLAAGFGAMGEGKPPGPLSLRVQVPKGTPCELVMTFSEIVAQCCEDAL